MMHAHDSTIVRTMSRMLIPLIQLFALYVLFFRTIWTGWRVYRRSHLGDEPHFGNPRIWSRGCSVSLGEESHSW